jgi:hypothetical protein
MHIIQNPDILLVVLNNIPCQIAMLIRTKEKAAAKIIKPVISCP